MYVLCFILIIALSFASGRLKDNLQKKEGCKISIQNCSEPTSCKEKRMNDVIKSQRFYKLTEEGKERKIQFPFESIPWLNQSMNAVISHTITDAVDVRWFTLIVKYREELEKRVEREGFLIPLKKIGHYTDMLLKFRDEIKKMKAPQHFANPSMESTFTDIFENERWQSDEIFVQQRLAGTCPFLVKKVTPKGRVGMSWQKLRKLLNPQVNFTKIACSIVKHACITLDKLVKEERLYVLYHEEINDMETTEDFYGSDNPGVDLFNVTSPITLFVLTKTGTLKVIAIQWDYKSDSPVFTPHFHPIKWSLAKAMVNQADAAYCQAVWHLSHVHFSSTVYCTVFRRHFSQLHPLYHILRYHCEGTTPHIALAWPELAMNGRKATKLSSIGHQGFSKLAKQGYAEYYYGILAYNQVLKKNGLDSKHIKYHPFRDDGKLLWDEFKRFSKQLVNMFYNENTDVPRDMELQRFANELSMDGDRNMSRDGARGKIVGFPPKFTTKLQLRVFLTRFLWHNAMHAAINYPLEPWGTFTPTMPFKLHNDSRIYEEENIAYMFPTSQNKMGMMEFGALLGNLRVNRIMDHHDKMKSAQLKGLVRSSYHRLHSDIQKKMERRNAKRKAKRQMGFQYFEPKWLTNSVHV